MLRIVLPLIVAVTFLYVGVFPFVLDDGVKKASAICRERNTNLTNDELPVTFDQVQLFSTMNRSQTIKCYVLCLLRELYVFMEDDEINVPLKNATGVLMTKYLGDIIYTTHFIHRCKLMLDRSNLTDICDIAMYYGHCLHTMKKFTLAELTEMGR